MFFSKVLILTLLTVTVVSGMPGPKPDEADTVPGLNEPCRFLWGLPCSNPALKCCFVSINRAL
ncbi:hypothetical protein P691DRAFT_758556 [Macrolepiota fuliginosa MF-IS2]|uniref:Uncharacterized protein n=1 Tax=Macrolepiota fuliginosa MF-IS2 TaxID=1400762 RepID=A0A9P6C5Q8_9AGAR|nr:hypothetical protein P691DRAFT_758556 [Macrolepiota fuliginosa MF-IS2]